MENQIDETRHDESSKKSRRLVLIAVVLTAMLLADFAVTKWLVPWADEHYTTIYGSLGYVVAFLTALFNFLIILVLVAYYFHQDSYPSDRWQ